MALQLTHATGFGFEANYWKILQAGINVRSDVFFVKIALFKDAAAEAAGKNPLKIIDKEWVLSDGSCPVQGAIPGGSTTPCEAMQAVVYEKMKTLSVDGIDFTSAIDV